MAFLELLLGVLAVAALLTWHALARVTRDGLCACNEWLP